MQVILLAAGQSTRLDPIADKNTLEFVGKPLIEHQISALKKAKLRDIAVVANKFNIDNIKSILKKYKNVDAVFDVNTCTAWNKKIFKLFHFHFQLPALLVENWAIFCPS